MTSAPVGSWPEEAAKLLAALQERARQVHPDVYCHLADAASSLAAAVRQLAAGLDTDHEDGGDWAQPERVRVQHIPIDDDDGARHAEGAAR